MMMPQNLRLKKILKVQPEKAERVQGKKTQQKLKKPSVKMSLGKVVIF
jgi:hypothetical protein